MYRILIADDEGIMLESLKGMITREFGDSCEITTVKTGRAAIEQAELTHPDILFLDIQMPGINGIQALREIRRTNPAALAYIVSAYDKFDYAREAIDLGVEGYLTKPVTKKTLIDAVREAMEKVDRLRRERRDQLEIQEKLEIVIPVVETGFVGSVLTPGETPDISYFRQLLDMTEEYAYICLLQIGRETQQGQPVSPVGFGVQAESLYPQLRAIVKSYGRCFMGQAMGSRIPILVPHESGQVDYEERVQIISRTRESLTRLEEKLPYRFRAGIGRVRPVGEVSASYEEALRALQESESRVVHINDVMSRGEYEGGFPVDTEKKIFALMEKGDAEGMMAEADRFFDWMVHNYPESRDNIRLKVLEYVLWAERIAFHEGAVNYGFEDRHSYLTDVMAIDDYERLRVWYRDKMTSVCRAIASRHTQQTESTVGRAMAYIQEHYASDISLDDVSREVNVSPYYFSKLFKEQAGENFIEYLTRIRIDQARRLLSSTQESVKEISTAVGYADPNYFSRIFKKQTGMTPREYREREQGQRTADTAEEQGRGRDDGEYECDEYKPDR